MEGVGDHSSEQEGRDLTQYALEHSRAISRSIRDLTMGGIYSQDIGMVESFTLDVTVIAADGQRLRHGTEGSTGVDPSRPG